MIRALLLDLDDTLLDERRASAAGFDALWAAWPGSDPAEDRTTALARWRRVSALHWRAHEAGAWTFQEQRRARVRDFTGTELDDDAADGVWEIYGRAYESAWVPVPGCLEFLFETRHLPRIVVTNGDSAQQHRKVERAGLAPHLDDLVTPADAGAWKPHAPIFRFAFDRATARLSALSPGALSPGEVLMVGDDLTRDIEPAAALGFQTWQVEPGNPDCGLLSALSLVRR